jgi:glutathione peroxidase|tara:strand:- start:3298 stop:3855 length:558 start_codon:yes stop_codon:yes gene_type:complete
MKNKSIKIFILIFFFIISSISMSKNSLASEFYNIEINSIDGQIIKLNQFKDKVVLIVNVASYCGFTKQYEDMQTIWDKYKNDGLIVLGVPSKSFNQEKDNENDIKKFCEVNFGINFPMTGIQNVKGEKAHELYVWARETYGKSAIPKWNFHKILVDKKGRIADTYLSFTNPNSKKIISRIEELLY